MFEKYEKDSVEGTQDGDGTWDGILMLDLPYQLRI